jgi:predicted DNA-binding transcriptional regulator AlpA
MPTHSVIAATAMTRWPAEDSIVRPKDQILFTGISLPTAYRLARQNRFPKPRKVGLRASGWLRSELEAFVRGEWQPPAADE